MTTHALTPAQANLDMMILNAESDSIPSSNLYVWLRESGLPSEVAIRLHSLVDTVKEVSGRVINIGKIILIKIIEFVKDHPNLAIGIALGAAIGALVNLIPFFGLYLAPIAMAISATIGAIAGHRIDKLQNGQVVNTSDDLIAIGQDLIEIAKEFYKFLADIFNTVFGQQVYRVS